MNSPKVTVHFLDLPGETSHVLPREASERWLVYSPNPRTGETWSPVDQGEFVYVPLVPHLTDYGGPATAMAYALQVGLRFGLEVSSGPAPQRLYVVVGRPLEEVHGGPDDPLRYRFHYGLAAAYAA